MMLSDFDRSNLPRIHIKGVPKGFGSFEDMGIAFMKVNPAISLAGHFGGLADKLYMDTDLCISNLSRKVAECKLANERASWFGGRIYNRVVSASIHYAEVSGAVIGGVLKYLGKIIPESLDWGCDYLLRLDYAEDILSELTTKARLEGRIE